MKLLILLLTFFALVHTKPQPSSPTANTKRTCRRPAEIRPLGSDGTVVMCADAIRKWTYRDHDRHCKQIRYSGCHGTDNLFDTKEACEKVCGIMRDTAVPACPPQDLSPDWPTGCVFRQYMKMEDGCMVSTPHCPDAQPNGACPPLVSSEALPPDCQRAEYKGINGCPYSIVDCQKGLQSS